MTDSSEPASVQAEASATAAPTRASRRRTLRVTTVALVLIAAGAAFILMPRRYQSTDAAYLKADETVVASQVRGRVAEVLVQDNRQVKAGDALLRVNSEELDARVLLAEAEVRQAQALVQSAKAALVSLDAEERLADANTRAVETAIATASAQRARTVLDRQRYEALARDGAVAARDAELANVAAIGAQAEADRAATALAASRSQAALTRTKRAVHVAALTQAESVQARSEAMLQLARQDQAHALVRAPVAGVVGALQVRAGDYVQPSSRLLTLVPMGQLYALAYFKETQVARMQPGQAATVRVDGWGDLELHASVESLAPGTGSQFALLPFEPGAGNFTKVVQRVPVRLHFDAGQEPALARLRPGLSSTVEVRLGD